MWRVESGVMAERAQPQLPTHTITTPDSGNHKSRFDGSGAPLRSPRDQRPPRPAPRGTGRLRVHLRGGRRSARAPGARGSRPQRDHAGPPSYDGRVSRWRRWSALFLLQRPVPLDAAERALPDLVDRMAAEGIVERSVGEVAARLDCRPYAADDTEFWVVSDLTPGPRRRAAAGRARPRARYQRGLDLARAADDPRAGRRRARPRHRLRGAGAAPGRARRPGGGHRRQPAGPWTSPGSTPRSTSWTRSRCARAPTSSPWPESATT